MVNIVDIERGSRAEKSGIKKGDVLISINGHPINDVLDYGFYLADKRVKLLLSRDGKEFEVTIHKETYDDIGLGFEEPLMDKKHRCENACIFCFIDQNPRGMRESIYFKDDDSRLSFLHGNYITLTNLSDADIQRIIDMHITPINISVHTTNPSLRVKMMKNKRAGDVLRYLNKLADGGCELHCQIVLCRGINDGAELDRTMRDLAVLYPAVTSVAVVPAGLTAHRDGLYKLEPFTPAECADIVAKVTSFGDNCKSKLGTRIFFASDEFYIKAGLPLPCGDFYEGYPQLENGVGMVTSFLDDIKSELEFIGDYSYDKDKPRHITIATGEAAAPYITTAVEKICSLCYNIKCDVIAVKNKFFGGEVTVSGLLTGSDFLSALSTQNLHDELLIPASTLRAEGDLFLDNKSPAWLSEKLGVPVRTVKNDAVDFICAVLGCTSPYENEDINENG
ncbi:MAG TPA: DUF512 domain-containing protein [Bacillota bacterium]|nr:DUF512 domain-containing protein [Bacillota bacterium]